MTTQDFLLKAGLTPSLNKTILTMKNKLDEYDNIMCSVSGGGIVMS